jgi:HlyD family secretion protein
VVPVEAPSAGRVLRVPDESERVVAAGTPLIEIGDAAGMEAVADVLSEDAVRIHPGDPMLIVEWGGDRPLHGRVRVVEPDAFTKVSSLGVEEQRVHVVGDLLDPPPTLGAGYRIVAEVVTWEGRGVLSVPTGALFQRDGAWRLFVVEDGRAALRTVRIGHRGTERAEVLQGLRAGDRVVMFPSDRVRDGVRVK